MSTLKFDFNGLSLKENGIKSLLKLFSRAGTEIVATEVLETVKRTSGVKYKEVLFTFADSQQVTLRVSEKGSVWQVLINGRVKPIKNQDDDVKAVIEIIDALDAGRKAFQRKLEARAIEAPTKDKISSDDMIKLLTVKRDALKDSVENLARELEEIKQSKINETTVPPVAISENSDPEPIVVTGNELGEFPDTEEGKKVLLLKAVEHFRGVLEKKDGIFNQELDKWVKFNGTARDKVAQFSKDERKLLVVAKLDDIVANGKPTPISPVEPHDKAKRKGVVKTHILKTSVSIKGEIVKIRFLIHEMKNGNFFYDHSVDREEFSKALGGSAVARNSADAAGLNNSALLQDEPSSQQRLTGNNLANTLDSVNGSRMVFNLFIEGEEPEYVEDDGYSGNNETPNSQEIAKTWADSVASTDMQKSKIMKLLNADSPMQKGVTVAEWIKQKVDSGAEVYRKRIDGYDVSKTEMDFANYILEQKKLKEWQSQGVDVELRPVVAKGDETLSIEQAIDFAISKTNGTVTTGDNMVWSLSKNSLNKMIAKTNKDGDKPYQAERIKAIQNLKELALTAKEPMIRDDENNDAEVEAIYEYMTKFSDGDNVLNLRLLCKKYKKPRKNLKDKMHSMAVMDKIPTPQTDNEISADGQLIDLEISFVQEKLEKGDVIGGADSTMGLSDLSPSVDNRDNSIANTAENATTSTDHEQDKKVKFIHVSDDKYLTRTNKLVISQIISEKSKYLNDSGVMVGNRGGIVYEITQNSNDSFKVKMTEKDGSVSSAEFDVSYEKQEQEPATEQPTAQPETVQQIEQQPQPEASMTTQQPIDQEREQAKQWLHSVLAGGQEEHPASVEFADKILAIAEKYYETDAEMQKIIDDASLIQDKALQDAFLANQ